MGVATCEQRHRWGTFNQLSVSSMGSNIERPTPNVEKCILPIFIMMERSDFISSMFGVERSMLDVQYLR